MLKIASLSKISNPNANTTQITMKKQHSTAPHSEFKITKSYNGGGVSKLTSKSEHYPVNKSGRSQMLTSKRLALLFLLSSLFSHQPNRKYCKSFEGYVQQPIGLHLPSCLSLCKGQRKAKKSDLDKENLKDGEEEYDMRKTSWVLLVWVPFFSGWPMWAQGFKKWILILACVWTRCSALRHFSFID